MKDQEHKHTPIWAYPAALLLLALLAFIQTHYFAGDETTVSQVQTIHSHG
jgi:hypothetical protein